MATRKTGGRRQAARHPRHETRTTVLVVPREFWFNVDKDRLRVIGSHLARLIDLFDPSVAGPGAPKVQTLSMTNGSIEHPTCWRTGQVQYEYDQSGQLCVCYEVACSDGTVHWDCTPIDASAQFVAEPPSGIVESGTRHV
jgi:hypothetical protein